ncbi:hypothetical protein WHZ78_18425 [Bradyrhizobium symbiodeficiens]|uniref:hypothetical protein n=1 Tax=Bradyrhizobium symbiodeficiens TaxID=1404367 RepID=UPI0030D30760
MPPRPKKNRHRAAVDPEDWDEVFETGHDGFSDLRWAGLALDEDGRPDRAEAHAAWRRYGRAFLADFAVRHPDGSRYGIWALAEFGEPT